MCRKQNQRGFGIVAAIFILVILAGLAVAITVVSTTQHLGSALDIQGARAYQAARTGIEWGLYKALKSSSCVASTDIGAFDGMTVTVQCTVAASGDAKEAGLGSLYIVTSAACNLPTGTTCPGNAGNVATITYVERRLSVLVEN